MREFSTEFVEVGIPSGGRDPLGTFDA